MLVMVRPVTPDDVATVHAMVRDLADYERAGDQVTARPEDLAAALFASPPHLFGSVAERDGEVVGMALWFYSYSTWTGRHGIYLEDLYVRPAARRAGVATALLGTLAARCLAEGLTRLEWAVLDWNIDAIAAYRALGAVGQDEWTVQRVTGDALAGLAARAAVGPAE